MRRAFIIRGLICLLLILGVCIDVCAQQEEAPLARVHYEFFHINDTLNLDKATREEMVLYIGRESTLYGSYASQRMMQQVMKQVNDPGFDGNLTINATSSMPMSYYTSLSMRQMRQIYRMVSEHYLLEATYPEIEWAITDETTEIGGYMAQKATGHFAGRDYVAWFTTELPFQGGPWKLQGLPGLLLEARTLDGEVKFTHAGIETDIEEKEKIGIPDDAIPTNPKALERLIEAVRKNPQAAMSARMSGRSSSGGGVITFSSGGGNPLNSVDPGKIKSINVKRDTQSTSSVMNNPLEKTNRK